MALSEIPCLNLAIAPLRTTGHFAVHVTKAPYPGGYVLHDCVWSEGLAQLWQGWQEMFSTRILPSVPQVSQVDGPLIDPMLPINPSLTAPDQPVSRAGRLMQNLGISLWQWLFDGPTQGSLNHSQGIAMGQGKPLRMRLEIRDPSLIALPWEIMQDAAGKQAISLSQQLLFSRTTSDVNMLPVLRSDYMLKILLVLGQDSDPAAAPPTPDSATQGSRYQAQNILQLEQEANALALVLRTSGSTGIGRATGTPCQVDTLVQPTPADLIHSLETQNYNIFFYSGHGMPAPDGGLLFLRPDMTLNGTELAQVLTRRQVKLAVFNACWGAQPDHESSSSDPESQSSQAIPRSSLAEVLIHHGVPAVLGMRDTITDEEALSFIQAFAKALAERLPIDQAVAVARQHLLTLYRFNQQAWTLPVLYMHPEFDGELLKQIEGSPTEMPGPITQLGPQTSNASLRSLKTAKVWDIHGGLIRVGRNRNENDLVIQEDQAGVSRKHAVIFYRHPQQNNSAETTYFLEDFSRFGTWLLEPGLGSGDWQR
ncbi:MAG: CHAT domain-containing protein, partial [Kovacikia sp.]